MHPGILLGLCRFCADRRWRRGHGAFRVQQMVWAGPEAELDQGARIGDGLGLPSLVGLVTLHGSLGGAVPFSRRFSLEIVLADQGLLNFTSTLGIHHLLPALF